MMQMYLEEEPELLRVIRCGCRNEAVAIINRLLVIIYSYANNNMSLVKSLLLEMLSAMNRAAVKAGADPEEIFSRNYCYFSHLGEIEGEEELSAWVCGILEEIMASLSNNVIDKRARTMLQVTDILNKRYGEHLTRDDVADELNLSSTALTRLIKEQTQCGFSQLLTKVRVGQAEQMLIETEAPLIKIAYDCGFTDQSYFTRIFNQHKKMTPREYRQRHKFVSPARIRNHKSFSFQETP